mmetsp:Transcript_68780/g.224036  ORF Transcript_68780/g.224036 Transcript_68780/m.224036 type:complete len:288 (+) Transcript_68780:175-1038(+)
MLPLLDDAAFRGGDDVARRLAERVHPSFVRRVTATQEADVACVVLCSLSAAGFPLSSLEEVSVANSRYAPTTTLIQLLKSAGQVRSVKMLTLLHRPLPAECLQSVRILGPLVLHATELSGFASLFAGGSTAALCEVQILDSLQLSFQKLLGAMPPHGPLGKHLRTLEIVPHQNEPTGRFWTQWIQPLAELLRHPLLASLVCVSVPVPSSNQLAIECAEALVTSLGQWDLPASLRTLRFLPYRDGCAGVLPDLAAVLPDLAAVRDMLSRCRARWPDLVVQFPGVQLDS